MLFWILNDLMQIPIFLIRDLVQRFVDPLSLLNAIFHLYLFDFKTLIGLVFVGD